MAVTAISIDEAFAQGSSWSQMLSVAKFHKGQIDQKLKSSRDALAKMPDWKSRKFKQELDASIRKHHESADYFEDLAGRMKAIEQESDAVSSKVVTYEG
ncbi:hypothetical protein [Rhizobium azibense]|uniref:Uncharacterized protein n=1 Tax=Rhizobium azibense TaxID=1136135 RepID=A0A4R3REU3_9HYPH|nr:hypothetical protein [Rhizobium azibense]TCU34058.1 hypothetical protein EV129_11341 [Rhizobium azibense]